MPDREMTCKTGPDVWQAAGDPFDHDEKLVGHDRYGQIAAGEAERLNPVRDHGGPLDVPVPDALIFHQHRPAALPGQAKPLVVGDVLVGGRAVHIDQRAEAESGRAEQRRNLDAAEDAVQE